MIAIMNEITKYKSWKIVEFLKEGKSYRFIQEKLKVSPNTIKSIKLSSCLCNKRDSIKGSYCGNCLKKIRNEPLNNWQK